jgi:hypothetical protein
MLCWPRHETISPGMSERLVWTEQGRAILAAAVDAYQAAFAERLMATYALGSLAHGGFSPHVSDVDLGLVVRDPLLPSDADAVQAVADNVRRGGSALHDRLSVFWGTPSTLGGQAAGGRFPPLDRLDLLEHGRLLTGEDVRGIVPRPTYRELVVSGAEFALHYLSGDAAVEEIRRPDLLVARGVRTLTRLVLMPVRLLFTAQTARVGANAVSVASYLTDARAPGCELVAAAHRWRTAPPPEASTVVGLLQAGMVPLYLRFIDDHFGRLARLGYEDLAQAFERWRERLESSPPLEESPG